MSKLQRISPLHLVGTTFTKKGCEHQRNYLFHFWVNSTQKTGKYERNASLSSLVFRSLWENSKAVNHRNTSTMPIYLGRKQRWKDAYPIMVRRFFSEGIASKDGNSVNSGNLNLITDLITEALIGSRFKDLFLLPVSMLCGNTLVSYTVGCRFEQSFNYSEFSGNIYKKTQLSALPYVLI